MLEGVLGSFIRNAKTIRILNQCKNALKYYHVLRCKRALCCNLVVTVPAAEETWVRRVLPLLHPRAAASALTAHGVRRGVPDSRSSPLESSSRTPTQAFFCFFSGRSTRGDRQTIQTPVSLDDPFPCLGCQNGHTPLTLAGTCNVSIIFHVFSIQGDELV